jgi:hypothetical protein
LLASNHSINCAVCMQRKVRAGVPRARPDRDTYPTTGLARSRRELPSSLLVCGMLGSACAP